MDGIVSMIECTDEVGECKLPTLGWSYLWDGSYDSYESNNILFCRMGERYHM